MFFFICLLLFYSIPDASLKTPCKASMIISASLFIVLYLERKNKPKVPTKANQPAQEFRMAARTSSVNS